MKQLIIIIPARGYKTTVASVHIFKVVQMYIQFPLLKDKLKIPVFIADTPLTCVVEGTGVLLDDIRSLEEKN